MRLNILAAVLAGGLALAGAADAGQPYDDIFFVRGGATAAALFQDRDGCRRAALHMSDTADSYSDPRYGALSAMGSALDEDALHDSGLRKRLQQAVFTDCMRQKGWTLADVSSSDARLLERADARHPQALDAWLKAHEPPATPVALVSSTSSAPAAAPVNGTAAAATAAAAK